jgi:DNA-binding response OmpR family regulator
MKILLVEDEEHLVKYLKKALENKKYIVEAITNGSDALQYIELNHENLDLIILDISLPKLSGLAICRRIRSENITTPVLMLTARTTIQDKILGLDSGADDYLPKPFSVGELLARIRALLRRPKQTIATKLTIGDIQLWIQKRKVYKNDQEVKLTLKEYEILETLMLHPNEVINRESLIDKVWDMNFNSFSNVIDVHIKNLRKKLEMPGEGGAIETIRGIGYRLKTE